MDEDTQDDLVDAVLANVEEKFQDKFRELHFRMRVMEVALLLLSLFLVLFKHPI